MQPHNITPDAISQILECAAIDHEIDRDDDVYVTGLSFNFWLRVESEKGFLFFSTFCPFRNEVMLADVLHCVNKLNRELMLVQFSACEVRGRLQGHYALSLRDGLTRKQILRTGSVFSQIFAAAIRHKAHRELFEELQPEEVDFECAGLHRMLH